MRKINFYKLLILIIGLTSIAYAQEAEVRDPFVSLEDKVKASEKTDGAFRLPFPIVLKGTLYSKNNLVAIVNDDIIKEGQKWKDYYVERIERGKVILKWNGKEIEVILSPSESKKQEEK